MSNLILIITVIYLSILFSAKYGKTIFSKAIENRKTLGNPHKQGNHKNMEVMENLDTLSNPEDMTAMENLDTLGNPNELEALGNLESLGSSKKESVQDAFISHSNLAMKPCRNTSLTLQSTANHLIGFALPAAAYTHKTKKEIQTVSLLFSIVVGARRLELPTPCTPCKCASQLRHAPILEVISSLEIGCKTTLFFDTDQIFFHIFHPHPSPTRFILMICRRMTKGKKMNFFSRIMHHDGSFFLIKGRKNGKMEHKKKCGPSL